MTLTHIATVNAQILVTSPVLTAYTTNVVITESELQIIIIH